MTNEQELLKELDSTIKKATKDIEKITKKLVSSAEKNLATVKKNRENRLIFDTLDKMKKGKNAAIYELEIMYMYYEDMQVIEKRQKEGRDLAYGKGL
ncbi:MAG: hypothetical protein J6D03_07040 [Clostridia bacterium]|nr:hypothetical protein [Clostridia bacterium]